MIFTLEQCKNISKLLKRRNIKLKDKKDISELLLNTLNKINCKNCYYGDEDFSRWHGYDIKCDFLEEKTPENTWIGPKMKNCPYIKYTDEALDIVDEYKKSKK